MTMRAVVVAVAMIILIVLSVMPMSARAIIDFHLLREMATKNNVTCILVFGDSSVDPGNNNRLPQASKGNFPPYGKSLFNGHPTGRLSNGRLATDFIAEALGYTNIIKGFLDPTIKNVDVLHGVSFASAGTGYDELTANLSNAISLRRQLEYFKHYKIHLRQLVGVKKAEEIIRNAVFVLSMGTNDLLQNYYREPIRSPQFSVKQYQNFLISNMFHAVQEMNKMGARRLAVVGLAPFGCVPLVKTLKDTSKCDDEYNEVAFSFNSKLKDKLSTIKSSLGMLTAYIDTYSVIARVIKNPHKYGFKVTTKGCCGSGLIEYSYSCKGLGTCADPTKYIFWDAVHPTEKMYEILAGEAIKSIAYYISTKG
ncbi:GDSL esterase/lipase At5g45950-like [Camellia sinensis]|uniref:GDSL esterase/lipase At5g45950-like n=1 Tax=Camellia sinensis TaxID=4442 RepID=UPI0010368753|nr:GDSL esterase/lipase At5g45950-like [Camellia sinensis]